MNKCLQIDCKGIECFSNLEYLTLRCNDGGADTYYLQRGEIKNIKRIYKLKKLKWLWISNDTKVQKLDLKKLKNLEELRIYYFRNLKSINVSGNKRIRYLDVNAPIKNINLKSNAKLEKLHLLTCQNLRKINLLSNKRLKELSVQSCVRLKKLDLRNNKRLKELNLQYTRVAKIMFPDNIKMESINAEATNVKKDFLEKVNSKTLKRLSLYYTPIKKIDISRFDNLETLEVCQNVKIVTAIGQKTKINNIYDTRENFIRESGGWLLENKINGYWIPWRFDFP